MAGGFPPHDQGLLGVTFEAHSLCKEGVALYLIGMTHHFSWLALESNGVELCENTVEFHKFGDIIIECAAFIANLFISHDVSMDDTHIIYVGFE